MHGRRLSAECIPVPGDVIRKLEELHEVKMERWMFHDVSRCFLWLQLRGETPLMLASKAGHEQAVEQAVGQN